MAHWYISSTRYTAVTAWASLTTLAVGALRRQLAVPAVGSERVFRVSAITTGITGATEPTWTLTAGGTTTDSGVTWTECTGQASFNGDGGGTSWGAPHARIANAMATGWYATGDQAYAASDHSETQAAALTLIGASLGTSLTPVQIISISPATVPPTGATWSVGATVTTTGANSLTVLGGFAILAYLYGINFQVGTGAGTAIFSSMTGANAQGLVLDTCTIALNSTASAMTTAVGQSATTVNLACYEYVRNCNFVFGAPSHNLLVRYGQLEFVGNTYAASGSVPTLLFKGTADCATQMTIRDSDLSNITGTLVDLSVAGPYGFLLENCKINASVTPSSGTITGPGGCFLRMHNCDSAADSYRMFDSNYSGTIQQSTAIFANGGASDGTTPFSVQMASSANCSPVFPIRDEEILLWNSATGSSKTLTIQLTSASTLDNSQVWVEVEYLGNTGNPQGFIATSRVANLGTTGTTLTTGTATWTGGRTNLYQIAVSFTPQLAGPVKARVYIGAASITLNYDQPAGIV